MSGVAYTKATYIHHYLSWSCPAAGYASSVLQATVPYPIDLVRGAEQSKGGKGVYSYLDVDEGHGDGGKEEAGVAGVGRHRRRRRTEAEQSRPVRLDSTAR